MPATPPVKNTGGVAGMTTFYTDLPDASEPSLA